MPPTFAIGYCMESKILHSLLYFLYAFLKIIVSPLQVALAKNFEVCLSYID